MAIREEEGATGGVMEGLQRKGSVAITRDDIAKKIKKYIKRLSAEKLLESSRFAAIEECFGQLSEILLKEGKEEDGYKLMNTASEINQKYVMSKKGSVDDGDLTDTELIDFLENKNKEKIYTGRCLFRMSGTGRGWRLHETDAKFARTTVRKAIADAIGREKEERNEDRV